VLYFHSNFSTVTASLAAGLLTLTACATNGRHQPPIDVPNSAGRTASLAGASGAASSGRGATTATTAGAGGTPLASAGGAGGARPSAPGAGASPTGSAAGAGVSGAVAAAGGGGAGTNGASAGGFRCPAGPFGAPVPANVRATRVEGLPPLDAFNDSGRTYTNVEGAVWIRDTLYVSEFPLTPAPGSRVLALGPGDTVSVALANAGTNGMAVDAQGDLIATDHGRGAIVRMAFPLGTPEVLIGTYNGVRFNSPNDLAVRSDGNIYFSDPDYQAPSQRPQNQTRVYRLAPGASEVSVVDAGRSQPNGVTLSADEQTLYVAGADGILAYGLQSDGSVKPGPGARVQGFSGSADGLGMDCAGNLYATSSKRVVVLSPAGMEIGSIPVDQAQQVTNVAFGGPEHKTLFITAMGTGDQRGVFKAELGVPGYPY